MSILKTYYKNQDREAVESIERLWQYCKQQVPNSTEGLSYGLPALKLNGRPLIGFGIAKTHLSLYPFSPAIIETLRPELNDYEVSKGVIRFTVDNPITQPILDLVLEQRLQQLNK